MKVRRIFSLALGAWFAGSAAFGTESGEYARIQNRLAQGWNTWDTRSVLTEERLPDGAWFAPEFLLGGETLRTAQPGDRQAPGVSVAMGLHSLDGRYSELTLTWRGLTVRVETASEGDRCVMLITPVSGAAAARVRFRGSAAGSGREFSLARPVRFGASTVARADFVRAARAECLRGYARPGVTLETSAAIGSALGWDTIYDASHRRVMTPVSRAWNVTWGGWVLFDWDTFFAGYMAGLCGDRDLASANVIEILRAAAPAGFVPNYASGRLACSQDRSEPPVGSLVVRRLYRRFQDKWLVEAAFPALLRWNRWWAEHRAVDGYLAWGSDPSDPAYDRRDGAVNTLQGAKYESGLDNSPMYDDAVFDPRTHRMLLADVGLMALYVADGDALAELGESIGRKAEAAELRARSAAFGAKLATLWDERRGLYLNRDLAKGASSTRISPTNFYPLLTGVPNAAQARRMIREHLFQADEFWGGWVLPATPRNDPAFRDQWYWRGRVWGPMNLLVYWGLERWGTPAERLALAGKSEALLLKGWRLHGQIHENYNAVTGAGDDVSSSDPFYSWGALLGVPALLQAR